MAAENGRRGAGSDQRQRASMRPRRMAAENASAAVAVTPAVAASMRPRRMAAENRDPRRRRDTHDYCFNEAAAHGRGKHGEQWRKAVSE